MSTFLTQEEITNLLSALHTEERAPRRPAADDVQVVKLGEEERIVRGRLPALETIFERFARGFRGALSTHLSRSCGVHYRGVEMLKYGLFSKRLPLPVNMHIWRMPPLSGQALLVFSPAFAATAVDCLFGGSGRKKQTTSQTREYSPIESRLLAKLAGVALEQLKDAWQPVHAVDVVYVRSECNPLALSLATPSEEIAAATFEIEFEHHSAELQFAIPYTVLERIKQKLASGFQVSRAHIDPTVASTIAAHLHDTSVRVSVELAQGQIRVQELLSLGVGDVITLASPADSPARVIVEGTPKFVGVVGAHRGSKAVRISGSAQTKSGQKLRSKSRPSSNGLLAKR